jgi:eukaryotic-like serine/threonine-protein kinase
MTRPVTRPVIARDALGTLTKLGQGGQGIVYKAPKVKTKFADAMVFKEYKPQARADVSFDALSAMPTLVEDTLSYHDGQGLVSIAAWPCALVENGTDQVGFVMPAIPDSFYIDLATVKGISRNRAEFQHLLNPPSVLADRGITITDTQRYQLLREAAKALSFLHRIGVCVGDISPKNLLFSLQPRPAVYFIDCDAMRINDVSMLPQMETPEWEVPTGEELATIHSDTYKLGLLALRLFAGDQHTKDVQQLPPTTPQPLRQLIADTLTNEPDHRPLPEAWTYLLGHVIEETQDRAPTPQTASQPKPAPIYKPEPQPVVRSRPTATPPAQKNTAPKGSAPPVPVTAQTAASPSDATPWRALAWGALAVLGILFLVVFIVPTISKHSSTRDVGSSPSTDRSTTTPTEPTMGTSAQPTGATTPQPTPTTAPVATLSPNQYGIVYIRTASGRTTCQLESGQVICEATPSSWPENGVVIGADGSTRFESGNFGAITPQTIGYQVYSAAGWTIAATSSGTEFTNDRTGHGAFVSAEEVSGF